MCVSMSIFFIYKMKKVSLWSLFKFICIVIVAMSIYTAWNDPKSVAKPFNRMVRRLEPEAIEELYLDTYTDIFPASGELESCWQDIRDEVSRYIKSESKKGCIYSKVERQPDKFWEGWNTNTLRVFGQDSPNAPKISPTLWRIIKNNKCINTALISRLEPGKTIEPHDGPYQGVLRYHLGLHIPQNSGSHISLNDAKYEWKNGEGKMFNECHTHYVINPSEDKNGHPIKEERVVLFLDIKRKFKSPVLNLLNDVSLGLVGQVPFML